MRNSSRLVWLCLLALAIAVSAQAQFKVVGPPDDETIIDTTIKFAEPPDLLRGTAMAASAAVVSSLDLSQLDCSQFPYICSYVDVLDNLGNPISGMTSDSFCVYQDGNPIPSFTVQQITTGTCATSICLVADISGSMGTDHKIDSLKSAMHRFVNNMDTYDQVAIVTFANCWSVLQNFTSNKTTLNNAINGISANGNTAVFDGIYKGVDLTRFQLGSKAVIAFTDGDENRSQNCSPNPPDGVNDHMYSDDSTAIVGLALSGGVPIYTFNLGTINTSWFNPAALQAFANGSGGFWAHAPTGSGIDSLYSKIKQRLCSRYLICYNSLDTVQNGDIHWTKICKKNGPNCTPCDSSSCQEKAPPVIVRTPATINLGNTCQPSNAPIDICAYVTDKDTPKGSLAVTLYYRTAPGIYASVTMTPTGPSGDSTFCASIPAVTTLCQGYVDYYITASDGEVTVSSPTLNPQTSPHHITICGSSSPVVNAGADTTLRLCGPSELCFPITITDQDCDITSVTSTPSSYSGNRSNFDEISKILGLGGTVTQVGGGMPGKVLSSAADFVSPISTTSGVSVTLPNFTFVNSIADYGSFPSGVGPTQSADQLIGSPTDLTFTLPGAGGPDLGNGDGSVDFGTGNYCIVGWGSTITTCNGSATDIVIFTNTGGGGTLILTLRNSGSAVYSTTLTIPGGTDGSGTGGITLDVPDGLKFNELKLDCSTGPVAVDAIAARTTPSTTARDICFNADTAGVYAVVVTATDYCGHTSSDTKIVTVTMNHAPVASAGPDISKFECTFAPICFPVSFYDQDNNIKLTELISGPGTLSGGQICFTPTMSGSSTFIVKVTDSCNAVDFDTAVVTVTLNNPPVAANPSSVIQFLCASTELCHTFTASDVNGGPLTWTKLSGPGSITSGGVFCFTPVITGNYTTSVVVTDSCGAKDTTSITYDVTVNASPIAVNPATPASISLCAAQQVCYQFGANDQNGGSLVWTKLSGTGTVTSTGQWCFTPATSGSYAVTVAVTDSCGAADTTNLTYDVTLNSAPTIAFGNDTSVFQCNTQPICVGYTVSDPDGLSGLIESMVSGYGSIDTANNTICFTPSGAGTFKFIASVTDPCGAVDVDTVVVTVTTGQLPVIACPGSIINITLCNAPTQVCQAITITPSGATVTASYGTYSSGQLCFTADTAGTYNIRLIATTACGADTCFVPFKVEVSQPPNLVCPNPLTRFVCQAGESICIPVGGAPASTWTVTPIGHYQSGNVCFNADTAGHYVIKVKATTPCGVDSCYITADVTINSRPVAVDPVTPKDTFLCASGTICHQFAFSDLDGGNHTWNKLSGSGSVSATGLWCFTPVASGAFSVTAKINDSCGAADTVAMTYNVTINDAPVLSLGNDTTISVCTPVSVCLPYALTDANSNVASIVLKYGVGTITLSPAQLCFMPLSSGLYTFIAEATDSCGAKSRDTINVTVQLNHLPVANAGRDSSVFQCALAPICWTAGATDVDGNLASVQLFSGPGSYDGTQICFTPTGTLNYEFVLKATDACGAESYDTVVIYYTLNGAPVANAGRDSTLSQCTPAPICWPVSGSDIDGNLSGIALVAGPGVLSGGQICFTPPTSGTFTFILEATDACGLKDRDTAVVNVTLNATPVCHVPNDTTIFQCTPTQICMPVFATDANSNLKECVIVSGPGAIVNGVWCYMPGASQLVSVTVRCEDWCGATCESQFDVDIKVNSAPSIAFAQYAPFFICAPQQICLDYSSSDPDAPRPVTVSLTGGGTLDQANSKVCFSADTSGTYRFILRIQDECGAFDADTINAVVSLNRPPVANAGPDQTLFLCAPTQICWPASCSDPDNNLTQCLFSGPGDYNGLDICFTPTASGTYEFVLYSEDACGVQIADTAVITVTMNAAPVIALGNDSSLFLCQQQQICLPYTVSDANGMSKLTEVLVSGYGTIDTVTNKVCFTPTVSGMYDFVVSVTDSCGASDLDTISIDVSFGEHASIDCPTSPINVFLCSAGEVCKQFGITPANATVTTSFGSYAGGQLCFTADTSGTYHVKVVASASCQPPDTCDLTFNVTIGESPQISCPAPQAKFICQPGSVCVPVSVIGSGASITVTPIGTYNAGNVCFTADTSGHYALKVKATTACGSDSCFVIADITVDAPPIAVNPPTPKDTFLCAPAQICYQFTASDLNGGSLAWSKLSGAGTVTSAGLWCFTPTTAGSYSVMLAVLDSCGKADTTTLTYNVTLNAPPTVALGSLFARRDTTIFLCSGSPLCVPYIPSDPNNNLVLEQLISAYGTIDTAQNRVCFTPPSAGVYPIIVKVTDACSATAFDTLNVSVSFNRPPVVDLGADQAQSLCSPTSICWSIAVSDLDNNIDSVKLLTSVGQIVTNQSGSSICFTPDTSGIYRFIVRVVDRCGAFDQDTVLRTIHLNAPPVCQVPQGANSFFQCTPTQISLPVSGTDPDGNFDHCEIVSGPGSIVSGQWVYTPSADEVRKVVIQCVDQCGAVCRDSFTVQINLNAPPVANAGADQTQFLCSSTQICWDAGATDEDNNLKFFELIAPAEGSYNPSTKKICFTPQYVEGQTRTYTFIVKATDSCNAVDYDTSVVTVHFNSAPTIHTPSDFTAYLDWLGELCFDVQVTDVDNNISSVTVSPSGSYNQSTQQVCFTPTATGRYCFIITATDVCQKVAVDTVCIDVVIDQCIHVQIEKTHNVIQGAHNSVNVYLNGSGKQLGGFDFLISYDASALTPFGVAAGPLFTSCGWEYFTYRYGADGNCGSGCPSGMLRIVGLAETNNGAYHPGCFLEGQIGSIAVIDFFVSNDRTLECQFSPVSFFWQSCNDNGLSSRAGDSLWISRKVFDFELHNITNQMYNLPGYWGAPDYCLTTGGPGKPGPARCVDFTNGGVDIVCADSIDARGDINLNEVAYEVADAVMFSNYFVKGLPALGADVRRQQAATAASDCNADGIPLTVADLVYLIRVVVGDAPAMPKTVPNEKIEAQFNLAGGVLEISNTDVRIGAIYVVVEGEVQPELNRSASNMELKYSFDGAETRILVSNMNGRSYLEAGAVLNLKGVKSIKTLEVGSFDGAVVTAKLNNLPKDYSLSQNYPNPFNPVTNIEFALPVAGEWELTVYNILGQQVEKWNDRSEGGYHKITWNASKYSSGVYFYRLTAGDFKATRKMVLLK